MSALSIALKLIEKSYIFPLNDTSPNLLMPNFPDMFPRQHCLEKSTFFNY